MPNIAQDTSAQIVFTTFEARLIAGRARGFVLHRGRLTIP